MRTNCKGQSLVCLLVNGETLPGEAELIASLRQAVPGIAGIVLGVHRAKGNAVLGETYRTLWGADALEDTLCGLTFHLSVPSFYQVYHDQAQRLYEKALEFAALTGQETVLDLYCGAGTITQVLARHAKEAVGAEIVPAAVADAIESARRNGVENVRFFCGDAAAVAADFAARGTRPDVICVDPPRKGLAPEVIEAVASMAPQRVVYVSCDPATLGRDVKRFSIYGYTVQRAVAVDLFPRTRHVETVVLLSRKNIDDHLAFTWTDKEFEKKGCKATYPEITAYIQEKYGFKVSNLNIAQIKHKCGIIERENYNLPKSENSRQAGCTEEKEAAIMDAFRHFQLIN